MFKGDNAFSAYYYVNSKRDTVAKKYRVFYKNVVDATSPIVDFAPNVQSATIIRNKMGFVDNDLVFGFS